MTAVDVDAPTDSEEAEDSEAPSRGLERFINRHLSWLDFAARVLTLAEDENQALLERSSSWPSSARASTSSSRCGWRGSRSNWTRVWAPPAPTACRRPSSSGRAVGGGHPGAPRRRRR